MTERIEIICPCGASLAREPGDDRREIPCPECGRLNVLPAPEAAGAKGDSPARERGKTTRLAASPAGPEGEISPGTVVGPYEVTGLIGEGGMGRVFLALDRSLQRKVALKVLSGELAAKEDFKARFRREARAVARLNHPNIVQIYYTGTYGAIPFYAMELVDGENLLDLLDREGPLDPARAPGLMIQAARGLAAAAEAGVIHRDVKPSNMVLERGGILKITDFGLAKTLSGASDLTLTGAVVGTPLYMSPEQGEGRSLDHRADIYSLGASFYHLLSGAPPFEAKSPVSIILKHINEELPPLRTRGGKTSAALAAVIKKMMAKSPEDRYAAYAGLIADLEVLERGGEPGAVSSREPERVRPKGAGRDDRRRTTSYVVEKTAVPPPAGEIRLAPAGLVRRGLAFAGDVALLTVFYNASRAVIGTPLWEDLFMILSFLYFFVADARGGVTAGKMFFRCRLATKEGEDLGFILAFLRTLLFFLFLLGLGGVYTNLVFFTAFARILASSPHLFPFHHAGAALTGGPMQAAMLAGQICLVWFVIDGGYYFLGGERRTLHDLVTGAYFYKRLAAPKRRGDGIGRDGRPLTPKDPVLAAILSTIFPGLGQFYLGEPVKGVLFLLTAIFILPYFLGILHAYHKAREINRRIGIDI